jgi:folylpolyglutamate synthase
VRERIRINGTPISEPEFAKYFFEVWDKLENDFVVIPLIEPQPSANFRCSHRRRPPL